MTLELRVLPVPAAHIDLSELTLTCVTVCGIMGSLAFA